MLEVREYLDAKGNSPYAKWFNRLNAEAAAKVAIAKYRMEQGNLSNAKRVGKGVLEFRINFGPGYRIYFAMDGNHLVIMLAGGTKKRQGTDIELAIKYWQDYKRRKRQEM